MHSRNEPSIKLADDIRQYLQIHQLSDSLPAISYEILALQLLDSIEQQQQIEVLFNQSIPQTCCDPKSPDFDPIKAIVLLKDSDYDEACWLCFLLIYTNDSEDNDWAFMRLLYGALGLSESKLTWQFITQQVSSVDEVLQDVSEALASHHPKPKFGHHRAYESLAQLPAVFNSYIGFIGEQGGHRALFKPESNRAKSNKAEADKTAYFQTLYTLIRQNIYRFGRLSTFEYLCLLGKMDLADVAPDSCYIAEASGPKRGAKLLFGMLNNEQLDAHAVGLADYLDVGYQQMEAAICHWQKSPKRYIAVNH
ncbi:hypothetical protein [Psychrobacter sp. FDAARGOS_221]|uniref:alpha-glutamyl/putrescinyl thymine pyrophosphorylase clade 3 protein n=1 Tax=Psychrobacter sp. FDAARGOS_221 TaxID=1975705 RepID=UPI000BB58A93|nr:hypothetical protein [Psychrobacter sp. FDAARGOS_221]PNK59485.1 hypothetical protein A6J60_000350 [Psychrobacter sp. FDAARGOS_221]